MAVTRPVKEGSVTTYQQKVALGFPDILASEMDADLDTIYAAWNGGVATANLIDGSVTGPKLATGAVGTRELADLGVATGDLANLAVTGPKLAVGAAYQGQWTAAFPINFTVPQGAWTAVASVGVNTRGGLVLVWIRPSLSSIPGTTTTNRVITMLTRDASMAGGGAQLGPFTQLHAAAVGTRMPAPTGLWVDIPTAGAHSYYINYWIDNGTMVTSPDFPGSINALELS